MIYGEDAEQYKRVWDFAETVKKCNPRSSMFITLIDIDRPPPKFQRMYMCLEGCKQGFINGCRPMLGLDGCHLKGPYPGQLLTAVAKDGNANIFPVAWAVVEVENKETWTWFLEQLVNDLSSIADKLAYISDRQKGLLEAFNKVTPNAELRFCCRHIWSNFSKQWSGEDYKQLFWAAAKAYTKADHDRSMEGLKLMSKEAYDYLAAIPKKHWCKHAFSTHAKTGIVLNNCCESFNNVLRSCRDKPILTMMEWIRRYVMKRIFTKRQKVEKYHFDVMNNARKQLQVVAIESRNCKAIQSGLMEFEVDHKDDRFVVNLDERKCGCFKWDLTGIPCEHAFACMLKKRLQPESFVDQAYSKATYLKAYSHVIHPLPGAKQWERTSLPQPTPPPFRKMPGRPSTKKRKRDHTEVATKKVARKKKGNFCSNCGGVGHYKKTCKNPGVVRRSKESATASTSRCEHSVEEMPVNGSQPQAT